MEAAEFAGQALEGVLLGGVVAVETIAAEHSDFEGDRFGFGTAEGLELLEGSEAIHYHVGAKAAGDVAAHGFVGKSRASGAGVLRSFGEGVTGDGRTRYRYHIDLPGGFEHTGEDLKSGVGGGSLQEGFGSLLSFLGAAAEGGESADLFPPRVVKWAHENADEIAALGCEVEEKQGLIDEN